MVEPLRPIELAADVPIPVEAAWRVITEPHEVARWFAGVRPLGNAGDPYEIDFGDGSRIDGVLSDVEPGRSFSHTWHWAGDDARETTQVSWRVEAAGAGGARVVLTHGGWSEAGLDAERRDDHEGYWEQYLSALQELVAGEAP